MLVIVIVLDLFRLRAGARTRLRKSDGRPNFTAAIVQRTDRRRVASISKRHTIDRSVRAGGRFRSAILLSQETELAGQLPDVLDRDGHAEDGA